MKTSVIICAYTMERWESLSAAVVSCDVQTSPPHEVIVVIDHNEKLLEQSIGAFSDARVISNSEVKGLSGARNTGVRAAKGEIVVFLDDDAYAREDWLEELTAPFVDPLVVGVGGWILPHWEGHEPRWFPKSFYWIFGCSYEGLPPTGSTIRNPIGASMALRRRVFDEVGGFTSGIGRVGKIPLGCEETELCIRYGQSRPTERIVLVHEAVVHHRVPEERCTWHYFWTRSWAEGLSKAAVASLVGTSDGLAAERRHVVAALPREVISSAIDLPKHPRDAITRVGLLGAGLLIAAAGFGWGSLVLKRHPLSLNANPATQSGPTLPPPDTDENRPLLMFRQDVDGPFHDIVLDDGFSPMIWVEVWRGGQVLGCGIIESSRSVVSGCRLEDFTSSLSPHVDHQVNTISDAQLPHISVVVPSVLRDPVDVAARVVKLLASDYPDFDVTVVDNRRGGLEEQWDQLPQDPRLRLVSETIPGTSAARNRGVVESTGEIIAFTDDDVDVEVSWLRALGTRFATDADIDAINGLVLPAELSTPPQLWFEEFYGGFNESFEFSKVSQRHHDDDPLFPYAVSRFGAGCNFAVRRDALRSVGGFCNDLGPGTPARGGEDLLVSLALIGEGCTVAFEPRAMVRHTHRRTREQFLRQTFDYGVGLSAMYTKLILSDPRHFVKMAIRFPKALSRLFGMHNIRTTQVAVSYPRVTLAYKLTGMAVGPLSYLRSWLRPRHHRE